MAGYQVLEVLIGIAVALLLTWLLLIAALAIRRPKKLQLEAAYRRFSPSGALPDRNRRLRLTLVVLALLVILNVVWLGLLLSRAPGDLAVESTSTQSATPVPRRRAPVRHEPPTRGRRLRPRHREPAATPALVRRSRRPFSWRIRPVPPGPSKPFVFKVRTAVEQIPFCGCSAGREASGWTSRYPPRPISPANSPPMSSLAGRVVTNFVCWTPIPY
jgi:hypothetical protein